MCRTPGKTLLLLKNNATDSKDKLLWKWLKGQETLLGALGDPINSTSAALCVYDASGLQATVGVPAGAAWRALGSAGFKYLDTTASADGVKKVVMKSGADGRAKIILKAQGLNLPDPVIPFTLPVTVQYVNDAGECWSSTFTATPLKSDAALFKVKEG